jgi:hypothetical protein
VTNADLIARIARWQNAGTVHPLTCGNDSRHAVLVARERDDGSVYLACPDCTYTQTHIPGAVRSGEPPFPDFATALRAWANPLAGAEKAYAARPRPKLGAGTVGYARRRR